MAGSLRSVCVALSHQTGQLSTFGVGAISTAIHRAQWETDDNIDGK
jgi:hypothetical protein